MPGPTRSGPAAHASVPANVHDCESERDDRSDEGLAGARIAELERRVAALNRVVCVGTAATGLAHEINNALTYVVPNIEFAEEQLAVFDPFSSEHLSRIVGAVREAREGASHLKEMVHRLQSFCRIDEPRLRPHHLRPVIEQALRMMTGELRHHASVVVDVDETPLVMVDDMLLVQVVVNLLLNAAHAIPRGHVEENEVSVRTGLDEGGHAFIEIRDTGEGIPDDVRARVFEPFFTTKPASMGTGLGLSISRDIVRSFGGEIELQSRARAEAGVLSVSCCPFLESTS
jgi:signal transduction histidine kinase